jgi:mRNA capping enzyme, beta chain
VCVWVLMCDTLKIRSWLIALIRAARVRLNVGAGCSVELEVRMKVSAEFFIRVVDWFNAAFPQTLYEWSDDFFYTLKGGMVVRTTRTTVPGISLVHVHKTRLASEDVAISDATATLIKDIDYCDLRVSLNDEKCIPTVSVGGVVADFIRRKQRSTYAFHKFWKLDVTKSYSGKTLEQVELKQQRGECEYELEIECVDLKIMLAEKTDEYIAEDAMLKSTALFTRGSFVASRKGY